MYQIILPTLHILSGIAIYAAITHLSVGIRASFSLAHILFGCLAWLVPPFIFFHILALKATSIPGLVFALQWNLTLMLIIFILLLWFISLYTGKCPLGFLIALSCFAFLLIGVNFSQPYSLQYAEITGLKTLTLPWGEGVTRAIGRSSYWSYLATILAIFGFGYILYALKYLPRVRSGWLMRLVVQVYLLFSVLGILIRLGILGGLEPGAFSYVGMILLMSVLLTRDQEQRLIASENRFRLLVEQSPFSIQILAPDGRTLQVNEAWKKLWKLESSSITDHNIFQISQGKISKIITEFEQGLPEISTEIVPQAYTFTHPETGHHYQRWIRGHIYPIKDQFGNTREAILMHEDVTEKKRIEDAIHLIATGVAGQVGNLFFSQLVQSLADLFQADYALLGVLDDENPEQINTLAVCAHGQIVSNLSYSLTGAPCANVIGRDTCIYACQVQQKFPENKLLREMGVESYIGTPMFDPQGSPLGVLVVLDSQPMPQTQPMQEILEIFAARAGAEVQRLRDEARIRRMAYQDYLTHLPNRAQFHEQFSVVLSRVRQSGEGGALLFIDLDHFKTINDALGHDVGDEVLRAIARRLEQVVVDTAFIARLGGDEFVILMTSRELNRSEVEEEALQLAQRIVTKLSSPLFVGDRTFNVGASIGVAVFPEDGVAELDIMRRADMALYRAKNLGRGVVQLYLPSLQEAATNRLRLEEGLRQVITNHELELYFQPQVNADETMVGAEVLLRWHHPELGDISPAVFIPVAEETGLIHSIGRWVLEQSCIRLKDWLDRGVCFRGHLSINVCPWQFASPNFVEQVCQMIDRYQLDAHILVMELTETALLYDLHETIEKLQVLRSLGIQIALDDFGTGYSSLAHIKDLPLDLIKIDKSFVNELTETPQHCLVESIIAIGGFMKLEVVAEGVESLAQKNLLIHFGCKKFQGYFFSRPLPEPEFVAWMNHH